MKTMFSIMIKALLLSLFFYAPVAYGQSLVVKDSVVHTT